MPVETSLYPVFSASLPFVTASTATYAFHTVMSFASLATVTSSISASISAFNFSAYCLYVTLYGSALMITSSEYRDVSILFTSVLASFLKLSKFNLRTS